DNVGPVDRFQRGAVAEAVVEAARNPGVGGAMVGAGVGVALGQQAAGVVGGALPPPLPSAAQYHVELSGAAAGPFPLEHLRGLVGSGQVTAQTLVWTAGMAGWAAAGSVPAVAALFGTTPPPLPGGGRG
ncbi:DUF4339 domain-containing protein, partial [Actinokineospora bangkokensis]|uniref:DUF4339 domain-containing protein n=1 Tax=Actinokineospora bangkokensis TaxID=1193682 RepID=UPI000AE84EBD